MALDYAWVPMGKQGAHPADTVGEPWPEDDNQQAAYSRERKRISWVALAFAAPAALILVAAERRSRRG